MFPEYIFVNSIPPAEDFCRLRSIAGLTERSLSVVKVALPRSCYGVHVINKAQIVIGMGRIVGDGALNFEIVDIAVDPVYQRQGIGREIMCRLKLWLEKQAKGSFVSLIATVPEFYIEFGFRSIPSPCEGMFLVWHLSE
ncbi:GNAT family N-acetyltransferase [Pectobacterium actinidiae]|uniref:GNAT family N-acetyltransferase n=1 Tax=Pectobacterium actinidiae TaxID=1507808 RepID=UPI0024A157D2|nr:GNAT family N-acetyltransferase [Pectobacterium actinidiae]MDY4316500.1 GNAT family N-acetyltransferase [Pectobacterium actinidiae]GLW36112.1 N-acetyltransferase [Pectobacterium carotovorum subsp. carotovorum]